MPLPGVIIRGVGQRDPTTFIGSFAMWAVLLGIALMTPGQSFGLIPSYSVMREVHGQEIAWGVVMFFDGALLFWSLFLQVASTRALIAAGSAVLWMMLGSLMLLGAWAHGFFSIQGAYSVWGAIGCLMAVTQWVNSRED